MSQQNDKLEKLPYTFIETILGSIEKNMDADAAADIISGCCSAHYAALDMDTTLGKYKGDIEGLISLMEREWGWQIAYDKARGIIEVNENKPFCVCPLVQNGGVKNPILCHCSEGFAKKMFGYAAQRPVEAKVTASVLMGDESCIYRIKLT
jgi:hypothetical protein